TRTVRMAETSMRSFIGTARVTRISLIFARAGEAQARRIAAAASRRRPRRAGSGGMRRLAGRGSLPGRRVEELGVQLEERLVVLADRLALRVEPAGLAIGVVGLLEAAGALVRDREVVVQPRVRRVGLEGALPSQGRLAPEPVLRRLGAELHQFLGGGVARPGRR